MKKNSFLLIAALAAGLMISGCTSSPKKQEAADEAGASKIRTQAAAEQRGHEQTRLEEEISKVPSWALATPHPDETGVYAVGIAESNKLRVAMRKAMLDAEFGLAKTFNQELSGSERSYTQDNNGNVSKEQYTALIDKLVSQVPVVGFEVVRQEVKPIDGTYNAFILVKLPYSQFNRVLQDQRGKTEDRTVARAFDDLDRRLKDRRQQRIDEAKQQQAIDDAAQARVDAAANRIGAANDGGTGTAKPATVTTQPLGKTDQPDAAKQAPADTLVLKLPHADISDAR